MDQRGKANFLEDDITAMVEESEAGKRESFRGLSGGLANTQPGSVSPLQ